MTKHKELQYKAVIYFQRKSLKSILSNSLGTHLFMLWFFALLFSNIYATYGSFNYLLYFVAIMIILKLFQTAMDAAEVGL